MGRIGPGRRVAPRVRFTSLLLQRSVAMRRTGALVGMGALSVAVRPTEFGARSAADHSDALESIHGAAPQSGGPRRDPGEQDVGVAPSSYRSGPVHPRRRAGPMDATPLVFA